MSSSNIQSFINKKLLELGITQKELALKAGVVAPVISNISNGYKVNIGLKTLCKLADALKCSVDEICGRDKFVSASNTPTDFQQLPDDVLMQNLDLLDQ